MKVRKQNLCDTCRKRKLQCDGKRPACTQCLFSSRSCEGYPDALFVPFVAPKTAVKPRTRPKPVSWAKLSIPAHTQYPSGNEPGRTQAKDQWTRRSQQGTVTYSALSPLDESHLPGLSTVQEKVSVILRNFIPIQELEHDAADTCERCSRFCGSWALALPELTADTNGPFSQCLHSAVSALALSITAYRNGENLLDAIVAQYEESLRLLGHSLAVVGDTYRSKLVAAVMCLALTEVMSPTQESSWLIHVEGVSSMVQLMPPEIFASGTEHTMLIGFRPLLILKAFILRKATFFAEQAWRTLPFQYQQAAPLQSLLGVAVHIPGILERIDTALPACSDDAGTAEQFITELMGSMTQLKTWHASFLASTSESTYWRRSVEHDVCGTFESLWYPSLGIANVFVYFWVFQLLCLLEIQGLSNRLPELRPAAYGAEDLQDECLELSTCIYKSMEYLLQEEFMLYGIASAGFALSIACETLQSDSKGHAILERLDCSLITRARIRTYV
ncbi:hypothetical protein CC86DRAFT_437423 [Ophiobolus disseminans]|uniref:Zn(2)-C6 fungal-type domain-containing protein n=1 Tax=Ophiobolus disseminans TaxID=1469910 RepID=A0A6A7AAE2_9PLEO|nr:hypothetical protein CC86DRAFT_437423 [Ophiobolus disseminans]